MYKSPIEIIQGQMRMEQENNILRAVMEQDIHVDKHELLRALQYDRGQYEKGYQDAQPKWIPVTERLPEERQAVLCIGSKGGMFISNCWRISNTAPGGKIWINGQGWRTFTHWMPLPEPPKEVE